MTKVDLPAIFRDEVQREFAYLPAGSDTKVKAQVRSRVAVIEKAYRRLENVIVARAELGLRLPWGLLYIAYFDRIPHQVVITAHTNRESAPRCDAPYAAACGEPVGQPAESRR